MKNLLESTLAMHGFRRARGKSVLLAGEWQHVFIPDKKTDKLLHKLGVVERRKVAGSIQDHVLKVFKDKRLVGGVRAFFKSEHKPYTLYVHHGKVPGLSFGSKSSMKNQVF